MGDEVYRSEKILTLGKKSFRVVKVDKHIQVFDGNSKAENPKALYDSQKDQIRFHRWWRNKIRE